MADHKEHETHTAQCDGTKTAGTAAGAAGAAKQSTAAAAAKSDAKPPPPALLSAAQRLVLVGRRIAAWKPKLLETRAGSIGDSAVAATFRYVKSYALELCYAACDAATGDWRRPYHLLDLLVLHRPALNAIRSAADPPPAFLTSGSTPLIRDAGDRKVWTDALGWLDNPQWPSYRQVLSDTLDAIAADARGPAAQRKAKAVAAIATTTPTATPMPTPASASAATVPAADDAAAAADAEALLDRVLRRLAVFALAVNRAATVDSGCSVC